MKNKSIKKNMLMNVILTLSNFIFPLITFSYISRVLTPIGTGKVAFVTSVLSYFSYIATLGIPIYGLREASKVRDNKEKLSKLVSELFVLNIISTIISYILLIICLMFVSKFAEYRILITIMSINIILTTIGFEWLYNALEEYSYITSRSIIFKLIYIPLTFLLIHNPDDYLWYGFLSIFVTSASYLCNYINLHKYVDFKKVKELDLKKHIKPILVLFSASIIINIYANFDVVMIGFIKDEFTVGLYNTALKLKTIILSISTATTSVLIPRIANSIEKKDYELLKRLVNISVKTSFLFAVPLAVYVLINGSSVILFLFGSEYLGSYSTLIILMVCVVLLVFTNLFGNQILIPYGLEKKFTISVFVGMIINLVLNLLLIPKYGAAGAAFGTLITELWNMMFMGYYAKKAFNGLGKINLDKFIISVLIAAALNFIILMYINNLSAILQIVISGLIYFISYYGLLIVLKEELIINQIKKISRRKKNEQ